MNAIQHVEVISWELQVTLLIITISLFLIWKCDLFSDQRYNDIALVFSIFILSWLISIFIRYNSSPSNSGPEWLRRPIIEVPENIRFFFGESTCVNGHINIWSIIHFVAYFFIGLLVPDLYWLIIILSILGELLECYFGLTSKFIIDPITNLFGYWLGSILSPYK